MRNEPGVSSSVSGKRCRSFRVEGRSNRVRGSLVEEEDSPVLVLVVGALGYHEICKQTEESERGEDAETRLTVRRCQLGMDTAARALGELEIPIK